MPDIVWHIEHRIDAEVSAAFAWSFWTNLSNWDDPPAVFVLDGPFVEGAVGTTHIPGQDPMRWCIRDVVVGSGATIDVELEGAAVAFTWRFDPVADRRTTLIQRITLEGGKAARFVPHVEAAFGRLPEGMKRLAAAMVEAAEKGADS